MAGSKQNQWRNRAIVVGAGVLLTCCCLVAVATRGSRPTPTSTPVLIITLEENQPSAAPPTPTQSPAPTDTSQPTRTVAPTRTPRPSNTPNPTSTRTAVPTEPEPVILTGNGDAVVDVDNPFRLARVHIVGNAGGRFFSVDNYGDGSVKYGSLVLTTDPYDGYRPLDFGNDEHTVRFQVQAHGDWTIEILPILSARVLTVPGEFSGMGDDVFLLNGADPDIAHIVGNPSGRFFSVTAWGSRRSSLVLTTDHYDGQVIVPGDTVVVEVQGYGDWTISIED